MKQKISLREAVCGIEDMPIKTLSKERPYIHINTKRGQILKDNWIYKIEHEGIVLSTRKTAFKAIQL